MCVHVRACVCVCAMVGKPKHCDQNLVNFPVLALFIVCFFSLQPPDYIMFKLKLKMYCSLKNFAFLFVHSQTAHCGFCFIDGFAVHAS